MGACIFLIHKGKIFEGMGAVRQIPARKVRNYMISNRSVVKTHASTGELLACVLPEHAKSVFSAQAIDNTRCLPCSACEPEARL
jgi:hypothetical protein